MATTFQVNEQSDPQNTFADILLSKLNDSKFVNDIVDRVFTLANRTPRTATIQQKPTPQPSPKEKETPKSQSQTDNKSQPQPLPKQTSNKSEVLTSTKNTVQIADNTQSQKSLETESSNDTLFSRFTKVLERTTSKLEDTVKKVPRPWELTPGTSMGYQMLKGDDSIQENARKGLAQFIGRYTTNIKSPYGYDTLGFEARNRDLGESTSLLTPFLKETVKSVIEDTGPRLAGMLINEYAPERDILYRDMFDLPARTNSDKLKKVGPKQYTLTKDTEPLTDVRHLENGNITAQQNVLGGAYFSQTSNPKEYQYNDIWDIITSGEQDNKFDSLMKKNKFLGILHAAQKFKNEDDSLPIRKLIAPLLKPATVSGTVSEKDGQFSFSPTPEVNKTNNSSLNDLTSNISQEVSKKIEKIPALSSLTKGLENIKGNKMLEGLKDISAVAPSVKPIVSFLTTNETGTTPETTIGLADTTKTFNNLKDWMKETTITKLNSWSTDLYDWSKDKITSATESIDSVFSGTEKLNSFNANDLKISQTSNDNNIQAKSPLQNFDIDSLKSLVKSVQPDISSLQNKIDNESLTLNNGALDQIVGNTKGTNEAVRTLSEAIIRLAQSFNNNNGNNQATNNLYGANTSNSGSAASRRRADIMRNIPGAAQVAATNRDPIKEVRSSFSPKVPPRFARFA